MFKRLKKVKDKIQYKFDINKDFHKHKRPILLNLGAAIGNTKDGEIMAIVSIHMYYDLKEEHIQEVINIIKTYKKFLYNTRLIKYEVYY